MLRLRGILHGIIPPTNTLLKRLGNHEELMRPVTLVYCIDEDLVLLGRKKRGFGSGTLNGYGGKVHAGERIEQSAIRELKEEAGLIAEESDLEKVAEIDFHFPDVAHELDYDQTVHVYLLRRWDETPEETEEMSPAWYPRSALPYEQMWIDDRYWLPLVMDGKKVKATFFFKGKGEGVKDHALGTVTHF